MRSLDTRSMPTFTEGFPCGHCSVQRVVMPLARMRALVIARADLLDLLGAVVCMTELYPLDQYVALCPGCLCLTADLLAHDSH